MQPTFDDPQAPDTSLGGAPHAATPTAELHRQAEQTVIAPPTARVSLARSSLCTIGGYAAGQIIRLAGNIIVSRLVFPEAFGLMAIINVMIQGLMMFSDVGIEPALVQNKRGDEPRFYNTAWTVQTLRGLLLFLVTCVLSYPVSQLYHEPRLLYLLPTAAAVTVLAGFNSTALFAVRRHLLIGRLTLLEVSSQLAGVVVMCTWAWLQPSVWAMVAGLGATSLVTLVGSHFLLPAYRNRFAWDRAALGDLFHFGKWVFVSTTITFCALQLDRLMLGRMISLDELGVYSVAAAIAMLPNLLLQALSGTVLYPLLSRLARTSPQALRSQLADAREILLAPAIFCVTGVVLEADTFFSLLYNERYAGAATIAQLMSLGVWATIVSNTLDRALLATGDTRSPAVANFVKLIASATAALVGFSLAGLPGFLIGYACGAVCGHCVLLYQAAARGISAWREDVRMSALLALLIALGLSLSQSVSEAYGPIAREVAVWIYLAAIGVWAASKARGLQRLRT